MDKILKFREDIKKFGKRAAVEKLEDSVDYKCMHAMVEEFTYLN